MGLVHRWMVAKGRPDQCRRNFGLARAGGRCLCTKSWKCSKGCCFGNSYTACSSSNSDVAEGILGSEGISQRSNNGSRSSGASVAPRAEAKRCGRRRLKGGFARPDHDSRDPASGHASAPKSALRSAVGRSASTGRACRHLLRREGLDVLAGGRGHSLVDRQARRRRLQPETPSDLVRQLVLGRSAGEHPEGATFATSLGGSGLPAVPIPTGANLAASCLLHPGSSQTGRAHIVATAEGVAFVVVLFQRAEIKVGRNRLWRLRDELAAGLPQPVREILTRGRTGVMNAQWTESCR